MLEVCPWLHVDTARFSTLDSVRTVISVVAQGPIIRAVEEHLRAIVAMLEAHQQSNLK